MKLIPIYATLLISLTSCAGVTKVNKLATNSFEISYTESEIVSSPALVQNYLNEAAMENCPQGYDKLKERTFKKEYMPTHVWTIQCVR